MNPVPSLHNLRLGKATGLQLRLAKAGDAAVDGSDVDGFDVRTPAPGAPRLIALIDELKADNSSLVAKWRKAIRINLESKRKAYTDKLDGIKKEIKTEQELQLRMVDAARRPVEQVMDRDAGAKKAGVPELLARKGGYSISKTQPKQAPQEPYQRVENTSLTTMDTSKWSLVDSERWKGLNLQVEAIFRLQEAIDLRENSVGNDDDWNEIVVRFINSLIRLLDYSAQSALLENGLELRARLSIRRLRRAQGLLQPPRVIAKRRRARQRRRRGDGQ